MAIAVDHLDGVIINLMYLGVTKHHSRNHPTCRDTCLHHDNAYNQGAFDITVLVMNLKWLMKIVQAGSLIIWNHSTL